MATSEDEDRTPVSSSGMQSATDSYEGDEGESYPGEDDDDTNLGSTIGPDGEYAFDDDFEFDDEFENGEFEDDDDEDDDDDAGDYEGDGHVDGAGAGAGAAPSQGLLNGFDDNDSSDRLPRTRSGIRAGRDTSAHPPPPLPQHNFAPPFYGRPPTPLPPSPSLTSLLRPSRPTTPDATDDELEPVPRAAPQVPTYEYYGFVLYLFSSLAFLMYLLWSYLPSPFLHALGIYYYPNRWWSLAIPSFLVMTLVYIYVALASYNTEILTLPLDSIETIVDGAAKLAAVDEDGCIVIVGGADGTHVQGRGLTAGDVQQKKDGGHPPRQASYGQASWSKQAQSFAHERSPSSPSPPLGKAAWRDRSTKSSKSRDHNRTRTRSHKNKNTADAASSNHDSSTRTSTTTPEDGITMGRGREWSGRSSRGADASYDGSGSGYSSQGYGHVSHRSPSDWNHLWNVGTDAVMDIPLAGVCEVLYAE